jgi:hypothetical protein
VPGQGVSGAGRAEPPGYQGQPGGQRRAQLIPGLVVSGEQLEPGDSVREVQVSFLADLAGYAATRQGGRSPDVRVQVARSTSLPVPGRHRGRVLQLVAGVHPQLERRLTVGRAIG